ncbi:MAG: radical SAM protein [Elusimicrobia bacterium]|nr:radical SAM protein [Elusimicrobiota bacterium]
MKEEAQSDLFKPSPGQDGALKQDGVMVRETACRTLLNRWGDRDYSFNCYTGCANGCGYCYARFMQRFHPHDEPWGAFVDVKTNAVEVLTRQARRLAPGSVFACSACDGWQAVELRHELTRRCCQLLLDAGFSLDVLTKSELVLRDLDIFQGRPVGLGVTITTPDEAQARIWEPGASPVSGRWRILKEAGKAGLKTRVMFGPLLPGISDTPEALLELFTQAAAAGVSRIWTDMLNPRPRVWDSARAVLRQHRPDLLEHWRRILFEPVVRSEYEAGLRARVNSAAAKAGVAYLLS